MSANIVEKAFVIGAIGVSVLFMGSMYFKGPKVEKQNAFKVRQQLLKRKDTKMLYSTMSFFYLQGFESQNIDSFYNLRKILEIEIPNLVALPISKSDYDTKYLKALQHPKFREAMDKFIFYLKNEDTESIKSMTDFKLKNLQKLYLIDHCHRIKKCKVVFGRRSNEEYQNLKQAYSKINETNTQQKLKMQELKAEDYTEKIIQEMSPKMKLNLLPESPYKTIIGIVEPELLSLTGEKWKKKFKQVYSHQVIEDEEVLEREKMMREARNQEV